MSYYTNGCHWGGRVNSTPSFFELCFREQVVIVPEHVNTGEYSIGDRVLLISGKIVEGVAEIISSRTTSREYPELEKEFFEHVTGHGAKTLYEINREPFIIYKATVKKVGLKHGDISYNYMRAYFSIKNETTIATIDKIMQS